MIQFLPLFRVLSPIPRFIPHSDDDDEYPGLRIQSFAIVKSRSVNYEPYIILYY
jgi:hypothetical protein